MRPLLALLVLLVGLGAEVRAQVVADFSVDVTSGTNPLTVSFTDLSTGGPVAWIWDFGDGTQATAQHPQHTYTVGGPYSVTLFAIASAFDSDETTQADLITVGPTTIGVGFSASLHQGVGSLDVQFTDTTSPAPTGWLWDFGDGGSSTAQHPSHTYAATAPTFDVELTVSYFGQSEAATQPGLISMAPAPLDGPIAIDSSNTLDVRAADLDADGDLDVLQLRSLLSSKLTWFRNLGGSQPFPLVAFSHAQSVPVTFGAPRFCTGDLDGDGDVDVLLSGVPEGVTVMNTDGAGTLALGSGIELPGGLVELADLDGDGDLDLAAGGSLETVGWWENLDGFGSFGAGTAIAPAVAATVLDLAVHDVDGDGDQDVAWAAWTGATAGWAENQAADASTWTAHEFVASRARALCFADFDGDGDDDLALSDAGQPLVWLEHLDGAGSYGSPQSIPGPPGAESLVGTDVDRDGDLDLVHGGSFAALGWVENLDGGGELGSEHELNTLNLRRIRAADLDGDGDDDWLVGDLNNDVDWYRNGHSPSWEYAGPALAGTAGKPRLHAHGTLGGGDLVTLGLDVAPPSVITTLVLGLSELSVPFKGGTLVPFPDALIPLPVEPNGVLVLHAPWPAGLPAGLPFYAQHWMPDAGAVHGLAASNALVGTTDP